MEFRQLEDGRYFPPVLPNGEFWAVAPGSTKRQMLFVVSESGLCAAGLFFLWSDITGSSITSDKEFKVLSEKYRSGGLVFYEGTAVLRIDNGEQLNQIAGYSIDYCLLNRICFESNRN